MLQFILGVIFGGFVTFLVVAIISINKTDEEYMQPKLNPTNKELGEDDAAK